MRDLGSAANCGNRVDNEPVATISSNSANQAPPLEGYDLYGENRALVEAVTREGTDYSDDSLHALGTLLGCEPLELGRLANEHLPQLRTHDRFGNRVDEIEFHPAWHSLLGLGVEHALHASPWREPRPGAHVARAAGFITLAQVEAGVGCPLSMTFASIATLRAEPELYDEWMPLLTSTVYDPGSGRRPRRRARSAGWRLRNGGAAPTCARSRPSRGQPPMGARRRCTEPSGSARRR